jgi:hypothetical protein
MYSSFRDNGRHPLDFSNDTGLLPGRGTETYLPIDLSFLDYIPAVWL